MIPCGFCWVDEYTEPAAIEVAMDEEAEHGFLIIRGAGDGTLELVLDKEAWSALSLAIDDVMWDLHPELQEDAEEG